MTAIVVAHNGERWLPRLLESLAAQTLRPARVVVVDAGSVDGTADQLRRGRVERPEIPGLVGEEVADRLAELRGHLEVEVRHREEDGAVPGADHRRDVGLPRDGRPRACEGA